MTCLLDPVACAGNWLAALPWGWIGLGLIIGALIGRWGVGILLAAFLALKLSKGIPSSEIWKHPDEQPKRPSRRRRSF